MIDLEVISADTPVPGGFHILDRVVDGKVTEENRGYLNRIKDIFEKKFKKETPIFRHIDWTETQNFEELEIDLPALLLDLEGAKMNPAAGEFEHEDTSIYSNLGELELYAYVKAVILVNNRSIESVNGGDICAHTWVRQLAFDVAGFVSAMSRFGHAVGMSQVIEIRPSGGNRDLTRVNTTTLISWIVRWQHSISLGEPDYRGIFTYPEMAARDVRHLLVGVNEEGANPSEVAYFHKKLWKAITATEYEALPAGDDETLPEAEAKVNYGELKGAYFHKELRKAITEEEYQALGWVPKNGGDEITDDEYQALPEEEQEKYKSLKDDYKKVDEEDPKIAKTTQGYTEVYRRPEKDTENAGS